MKHVILLGLRRSGTTITYKIFTQDKRFTCFKEPFSFYTYAKFKKRLQNFESFCENRFRLEREFSYIFNEDEINSELSERNKQFLKALCQFEHSYLDITRCHFKINELRKTIPNALIILLIRDVRAWITSHINPSAKIVNADRSEDFFKADKFNTWRYQEIGELLGFKGYGHQVLSKAWQSYHLAAIKSHPDLIIQFEKFAYDPEKYFKEMYSHLDIDYESLDFSEMHEPNKPFVMQDKSWNNLKVNKELEKYIYWKW